MRAFEELNWDRSKMLAPAKPEEVGAAERAMGFGLPLCHRALLAFADGGVVNGAFILYAVGEGIHQAERLVPANRRNGEDCPLVVIGREASDDFGFRKEDLRGGASDPAVYFLSQETWELTKAAASLFEFLTRATGLKPGEAYVVDPSA